MHSSSDYIFVPNSISTILLPKHCKTSTRMIWGFFEPWNSTKFPISQKTKAVDIHINSPQLFLHDPPSPLCGAR